jgi:hypothetical protein
MTSQYSDLPPGITYIQKNHNNAVLVYATSEGSNIYAEGIS